MSTLANQPAFPGIEGSYAASDEYQNRYTGLNVYSGMTLRQYYAGIAMQGLLANPALFTEAPQWMPRKVAEAALNNADALIAELEKTSA